MSQIVSAVIEHWRSVTSLLALLCIAIGGVLAPIYPLHGALLVAVGGTVKAWLTDPPRSVGQLVSGQIDAAYGQAAPIAPKAAA